MREARARAWAWLLAVALSHGASAAAATPQVKALRLWPGPDATRAVFDVSGPIDYKLFELANPDRIVLDIRGADFAEGFAAPPAKGPLKAVRVGRHYKVSEMKARELIKAGVAWIDCVLETLREAA